MKRFFSALAVALASLLVICGDAVLGSGASLQAIGAGSALPVNTASASRMLADVIPSPDAARLSSLIGEALTAARESAAEDGGEPSTGAKPAEKETAAREEPPVQEEEPVQTSTALNALGVVTGSGVRMRSGSSTESSILRAMEKGAVVELTAEEGDWYKASYDGDSGYISARYVTRYDSASGLSGAGRVTADVLNIRSAPGSGSSAVGSVQYGSIVTVTGIDSGWYAVSYNGVSGYVSSRYVVLCAPAADVPEQQPETPADKPEDTAPAPETPETPAEPPSSSPAGAVSGSQVVSLAQQYLGVPYVYGGSSPSGFDCSGFTMYIFSQVGVSLPHGATSQLSYGTAVSYSELQPGDLVFFQDYGAVASHVGIYIGDGQFIHASSSSYNGKCVVTSSLSETYYANHYYTARRH